MRVFSISKSPKDKVPVTTPMTTPGSGTYMKEEEYKRDSPNWTMKQSGRKPLYTGNTNPGPGCYEIKSKDDGPKFEFGKKQNLSMSAVPGPGSYEINTSVSSPKKCTMYGKFKVNHATCTPGPGNYEVEMTRNSPGGKFLQKKRDPLFSSSSIAPGPGEYPVDSFKHLKSASVSFTFTPKREKILKDSPGPGKYEHSTYVGKVGMHPSFSSRRPDLIEEHKKAIPGPGNYLKEDVYQASSPSYKLGQSPQRSEFIDKKKIVPDPGKYEIQDNVLSKNSRILSYSMSKTSRPQTASATPGPGYYEHNQNIGQGPKWGIRPVSAASQIKISPGPGSYEQEAMFSEKRSPTSIGFGSRITSFADPKNTPGPGKYEKEELQKPGGIAYTFSPTRRPEPKSNVPGPGSYKVPTMFSEIPQYALQGKSRDFDYI